VEGANRKSHRFVMADASARSRYGGWTALTAKATGYFRIERIGSRWWLSTRKERSSFRSASTTCPHLLCGRLTKSTHAAIRRYDSNHLILGDRYLGQRHVPDCVLEAMRPTVDVLSVQFENR
jgi:hypothetical protein